MKKTPFIALALTALLCACSSNNKKSDPEVLDLKLRNYAYADTLQFAPSDSTDNFNPYISVIGQGMIPLEINSNDVTQLRDSLLAMAGAKLDVDGAVTEDYDDLSPIKGKTPDEIGSWVKSLLSVSSVENGIIVWKAYSQAYYDGAAHGIHSVSYLNYRIEDNKILSLADIFKPGYEEELTQIIRGNLKDQPEVFSPDEAQIPSQFYLSPYAITFVYPIYEIAPYSAGDIEVKLYTGEIESLLSPEGEKLFAE